MTPDLSRLVDAPRSPRLDDTPCGDRGLRRPIRAADSRERRPHPLPDDPYLGRTVCSRSARSPSVHRSAARDQRGQRRGHPDTPVQTLLSNASVPRRGASEITLEHLATHRSDCPAHRSACRPNCARDAATSCTTRWRPARSSTPSPAPGSPPSRLRSHAYSNLRAGVLLLALVAAARADTYADLVSTRICAPLGMTRTTVLAYAQQDRLATGHWNRRRETRPLDPHRAGRGRALLSSGSDIITFPRVQLDPMSTPLADVLTLSQ